MGYPSEAQLKRKVRLRGAMRLRGRMTVRSLANKAGVSASFIQQLRTDCPAKGRRGCSAAVAERICRALDVPVDRLFDVRQSSSTGRIAQEREAR